MQNRDSVTQRAFASLAIVASMALSQPVFAGGPGDNQPPQGSPMKGDHGSGQPMPPPSSQTTNNSDANAAAAAAAIAEATASAKQNQDNTQTAKLSAEQQQALNAKQTVGVTTGPTNVSTGPTDVRTGPNTLTTGATTVNDKLQTGNQVVDVTVPAGTGAQPIRNVLPINVGSPEASRLPPLPSVGGGYGFGGGSDLVVCTETNAVDEGGVNVGGAWSTGSFGVNYRGKTHQGSKPDVENCVKPILQSREAVAKITADGQVGVAEANGQANVAITEIQVGGPRVAGLRAAAAHEEYLSQDANRKIVDWLTPGVSVTVNQAPAAPAQTPTAHASARATSHRDSHNQAHGHGEGVITIPNRPGQKVTVESLCPGPCTTTAPAPN